MTPNLAERYQRFW